MRRLLGRGTKRHPRDVETAVKDGRHSIYDTVLEPKSLMGKPSQEAKSIPAQSDGDEADNYHTTLIDPDHQSAIRFGLASLTTNSDSSPRLLTDEENEGTNRRIDRLIAAVDGRRPLHFAASAETGEIDIFADRYGQQTGQDEYELEPSPETEIEIPQERGLVRTVQPIRLDFNKPLGASTPTIHSSSSELDTSSPLFGKSCKRILRDTYAEPPNSEFQRELPELPERSQLDEWAFVYEPRNEISPEARQLQSPSTTRKAFGVFEDVSNGESSSRRLKKPAARLKALNDISNLRRPGYLQFNSFAKDANTANHLTDTAVTGTASSMRSRGAKGPESPPLSIDPVRQAHFDAALARLEGRALPVPPSLIRRHADSAALFDRDIQTEENHRPLPLHSPTPVRPINLRRRRAVWPHFE